MISGGTFIDGDNRLIVRRLSPDGMSLKWSSIACTGRNGRGIAVDPRDQSVVVVGDGTGANADDNIRLCKHSSNGALLWGKDIDSDAGSDFGYGVAITPAGTIIAVGIIAAPGGSDAWVAAFAP
ncbi:MAG: hypothetical protein IPK80_07980 [Nannocystis sp.]|nr:hypothetical protein [Nannocystis sp.]